MSTTRLIDSEVFHRKALAHERLRVILLSGFTVIILIIISSFQIFRSDEIQRDLGLNIPFRELVAITLLQLLLSGFALRDLRRREQVIRPGVNPLPAVWHYTSSFFELCVPWLQLWIL